MTLGSTQKKILGISLIVLFLIIELLFVLAALMSAFSDSENSMGSVFAQYFFVMVLFFFPIWGGCKLWKSGNEDAVRKRETLLDQDITTTTFEKIKVEVKVELPEYRKLIFQLTYKRPAFLFINFMFVGLTVVYFANGNPGWYVYLLVLLLLYFPFAVYLAANSNYKSTKMLHEVTVYEFSREGISATGESFNTTMQWTSLHKVTELKEWFLLYTSKQVALFIPKKAFASATGIEDFKKMARLTPGKKL